MEPATSFFKHPLRSTCRCMFGLVLLCMQFAHAQTFEWAHKFGTNGIPESVNALVTDNEGNYYVAGIVSGTFTYASSNNHIAYFGDTTVSINGADDIFIAKYSSNGNLKWAKTFGGDYDWNPSNQNSLIKRETINGFYYNQLTDRIYISGSVVGNCSIDGNFISNSSTSANNYIACFNKNGACVWAIQIGDLGQDSKVIITSIKNNVLFSGVSNTNFILNNFQISKGAYLGILNDQGICINAKTISKNSAVTNLQTLDSSIYITVNYGNQDSIIIGDSILPINLNRKGFCLASFDNNFNNVWLRNFYTYGWFIEPFKLKIVDSSKLVFLTSYVSDIYTDTDTILYSSQNHVVFSEYNLSGYKTKMNQQIANHMGDYFMSDNKLIAIGGFSGYDTLCGNEYNSGNNWNLYIANYDSSFFCSNTLVLGQGCNFSVISDPDSTIIIAGIIGSPGSDCSNCSSTLNLGDISLTSAGSTDGFLAKFNGFTSGIDDRSKKVNTTNESLLIYANPSNGVCDVEIPEAFIHEKELTLNIFSNTGVLIQQVKVDMSEAVIKVDIQQQAKGMYTATLSNGSKLFKGRIVFE